VDQPAIKRKRVSDKQNNALHHGLHAGCIFIQRAVRKRRKKCLVPSLCMVNKETCRFEKQATQEEFYVLGMQNGALNTIALFIEDQISAT
jgi:hypothetical protein